MKFSQPWYRKSRKAWFVTLDGKQIKLGKTKKEAQTRYHELMLTPQKREVRSDSILAIIDAFLEWTQKNRSPDTYEWYRHRLERFAQQYPDLLTKDLRPFHVETWVDQYDIAKTTRRNYLRTMKRCMKWATKQGYIDKNPIADLEIPAGENKEIFITQEEYEKFHSFIRNDQLRDLVVTTWETGCRPQESMRVEARHVDLQNQRWVFPKSESKNKRKSRIVYLPDVAVEITRRLVAANPSGPLFRNCNGVPWSSDSVNTAIDAVRVRFGKEEMKLRGEEISAKEIQDFIPMLKPTKNVKGNVRPKTDVELRSEAKSKLTSRRVKEFVPRYSLYALRHSWATNALQKGMDPLTVAILMGHSDPSMLSKVYQHLSLDPQHMLKQAKRAAS